MLADDLLRHANDWLAAGAPRTDDFDVRFVPVSETVPTAPNARWVIRRIDHDEAITLSDRYRRGQPLRTEPFSARAGGTPQRFS
jgi:hypothetical protein